MRHDSLTLHQLRRALLGLTVAGLLGTGSELLLLGHVEGPSQLIPVVLIALSLVASAWQAAAVSPASLLAFRAAMGLCLVAGVVGLGLHYQGNLEFELEMYPTMSGLELVQKVATGATPVLAPGALSLLGVIGLLHAFRHPGAGSGMRERE